MIDARGCLNQKEWVHGRAYFQENSYWAHWEAILLALLSEDDPELRIWAVNLIIQIRQDAKPDEVRYWQKPNLIFDPMPEHYR